MTVVVISLLSVAALSGLTMPQSPSEKAGVDRGGWVKSPANPVLGDGLGTCFDACVLKEGNTFRMWFSWRPRKSIALTESRDGIDRKSVV